MLFSSAPQDRHVNESNVMVCAVFLGCGRLDLLAAAQTSEYCEGQDAQHAAQDEISERRYERRSGEQAETNCSIKEVQASFQEFACAGF